MKKIILLALTLAVGFTLSACTDENTDPNDLGPVDTEILSSEESLATLSYLSAGFLDFSNTTPVVSNNLFLANIVDEETVVEGELEEVNIYIDRLKALIDNGVESFGSVVDEVSDNELYAYKMTFTVNEEIYVIYYNVDEVTLEMTGIIVIGTVEYEFEVVDNIKSYEYNEEVKNKHQNDDDENGNENSNKDETDDEVDEDGTEANTEESENEQEDTDDDSDTEETKMVLIARNGEDIIKIMYKTETEEDETSTKFYLEQTIDGVTKEINLKIVEEENEYKVMIEDGEDRYTFKRELEEEGNVYKLQYKIDGVVGMVRITEIIAEDGTITYDYFIQEAGKEKNLEKQEPHSNFDDDDDDENEDEEEENEDEEDSTV